MRVSEKMTKRVVSVTSDATLAEVKAKMDAGGFRRVPVVDKGKLAGIVSERDLRQHAGALAHTKVNAAMSTSVVTASPMLAIESAARLMVQHKIGGLPVVEQDGTLVGIITATDLLAAFVDFMGGVDDSSSRIDVALEGELDQIATAIELAASQGGQVFGVGTYKSAKEGKTILHLRVPTSAAHATAKTLGENGFKVLSIFP